MALVVSLLFLLLKKLQNANEEVDKIEEELKGVHGNVLVTSLCLKNHNLSIVNNIARKEYKSKEDHGRFHSRGAVEPGGDGNDEK